MREVVQIARRTAKGALNVLILGETGAGKERFAHAIHAWSERSGAFLAVNCAGYSESTAAAELFGYKRGTFTGADQASPGHVRAADGGTLLLDEILDLPLSIQAKLLRTLEQREVLPLGETQPKSVDVRFLAASQIPLAEAVARGSFRADLCARLEGMVVKLPSLRERRADIVPLFLELLLKHGHAIRPRLDSKLVERLCLYHWPMNVRELENLARRVAAEHRGAPEVTLQQVHDLFDFGGAQKPTSEPDSARLSEPVSLAESASGSGRRSVPPYKPEEFSALEAALARQKGNLTKAAAELGMTRPKAYRMLKARKPAK
jgi:two-component system, response regulator FlrC